MADDTNTLRVPFREKFAYGFGVERGSRLMVSVIPAVVGIVSVSLMFLYPLKEDLLKRIAEELAARRKEADETSGA
jgi:Na+/melibiose symporter-like transporter